MTLSEQIIELEKELENFRSGKEYTLCNETIGALQKEIDELEDRIDDLERALSKINTLAEEAIQ
jgi:molecular chaperone GrpE (heat shock protein)